MPHPGDLASVLAVVLVLWLPTLTLLPARRPVLRRGRWLTWMLLASVVAVGAGWWLCAHWS